MFGSTDAGVWGAGVAGAAKFPASLEGCCKKEESSDKVFKKRPMSLTQLRVPLVDDSKWNSSYCWRGAPERWCVTYGSLRLHHRLRCHAHRWRELV